MIKIFSKIKRELIVGLSKLCLKKATSNYLGLNLKFPIIYGMGRGYIIPAEFWMGECLSVFLKLKSGAVIDVGANVGIYLVKLRVFDKNRKYYGFEPNPACTFYCQELIRLNNFGNSYIFPFALSDKKGVRTLFASKRGDKGASMHKFVKRNSDDLDFSFEMVTLQGDNFIDSLDIDDLSVIKIDVEGAELEVLKGLRETVNKFRPFIYCELWNLPGRGSPTYNEKKRRQYEIYNFLMSVNYSIVGRMQDNKIEEVGTADKLSEINDNNYIFSPRENVENLIGNLSRACRDKFL